MIGESGFRIEVTFLGSVPGHGRANGHAAALKFDLLPSCTVPREAWWQRQRSDLVVRPAKPCFGALLEGSRSATSGVIAFQGPTFSYATSAAAAVILQTGGATFDGSLDLDWFIVSFSRFALVYLVFKSAQNPVVSGCCFISQSSTTKTTTKLSLLRWR